MAFSDLKKYYNNIKDTYYDALQMCVEFDKEHNEGVLEDKDFKKFKKNLSILRDRYELINNFFLLWSKPTEEELSQMSEDSESGSKNDLSYLANRNADNILKENSDIIKSIYKYIESKKKD